MTRSPLLFLSLCLAVGGISLVKAQETPASPPQQSQSTPTDVVPQSESSGEVSIELEREGKDGKVRIIKIVRGGTDEAAYAGICSAQEDESEDMPTIVTYSNSISPGVTVTLDKNRITAPLAIITKKQGGDGHIEMSAGKASEIEKLPENPKDRLERCGILVEPEVKQESILVTQGKTHLKGQKLVYDETDGIARIDGPITFERANDKEPLSGSSERIDVNVDEETTTLIGNVVLTSKGGRVSKAPRVEYDDTTNTARLYGTPEQAATSTKGTDTISLTQGYILYDLDTNNVVARADGGGNITGEFQDSEAPSSATSDSAAPGSGKK